MKRFFHMEGAAQCLSSYTMHTPHRNKICHCVANIMRNPKDEFLDVVGEKVVRVSSLLFTVTSTYTDGFCSPPLPLSKSDFETGS